MRYMFYLAILVLVAALFTPKKTERPYSKLDNAGVILNWLLLVLYLPISWFGIVTVFAFDNPSFDSKITEFAITAAVYIGIYLWFISAVSLSLSLILRKRGFSVPGFIVQFIPLFLFILILAVFTIF